MTRPSSKCSLASSRLQLLEVELGRGTKKKNVHFSPALTSLLSLQFQGTPADTTLHWLAPSEGCLHVHRANAPAPFTQPSEEKKKKTFWYWNSCKRENTAPTYSLLLPFLMQYFFFHVRTINFYVPKSTRGKKREKRDCHPFVNFLHPKKHIFKWRRFKGRIERIFEGGED